MKIHNLLSVALLLLASAGLASAQSHLYIAGSTANRAPADAAIIAQFDGGAASVSIAADAAIGGEHSSIFSGTIGGAPWIIKCAWTGSENGIQLASSGTLFGGFLLDSYVTAVTPGTVSTSAPNVTGNTSANTGTSEAHVADAGFADTFANASQFQGTYQSQTYTAPVEVPTGSVAINPFKFWTNFGAPAGLTNITQQNVRKIYIAGKLPLSFFTGVSTDSGSTVYAVGRNPDSGTRVTAMLETGLAGATQAVTQFAPENGGSVINAKNSTVTALAKYPSGSVDGITFNAGNNGYSSGGNLAAALNCDYTNGGAGITAATSSNTYNATGTTHFLSVIAYASTNDGDGQLPTSINPNGVSTGGIVELAFNGVKMGFSSDYNNNTQLTSGHYTFWSYEHLYVNTLGQANPGTPASPNAYQTVINNIATSLPTAVLPTETGIGVYPVAVKISNMQAARTADGGVIGISSNATVY